MFEKIGSYDAKTKLPEILRKVSEGHSFTITNHGRPVADLIPCQISRYQSVQAAIDNILAAKKHPVPDDFLLEIKGYDRR